MHKQTFYRIGTRFIAAIMIVMLALAAMPTNLVQAADTGWQNPANNAATTGGDNNGFETNPANAYTDGAGNATNSNGAGDRHIYYGYNFSGIPSGDIIDGIEVSGSVQRDNGYLVFLLNNDLVVMHFASRI